MRYTIDNAYKIVNKINLDFELNYFFTNGGCSKLARHLLPYFKETKVSLLCFIYKYNERHENEILEILEADDIFDLLLEEVITIDHVALFDEKTGLVFDAYGVNPLDAYLVKYKLDDNFCVSKNFYSKREVVSFFKLLYSHHKYGYTSKNLIKDKINAII